MGGGRRTCPRAVGGHSPLVSTKVFNLHLATYRLWVYRGGMADDGTTMAISVEDIEALEKYRDRAINMACSLKSVGVGRCVGMLLKMEEMFRDGKPYPGPEWFASEIDAVPNRGRPRKRSGERIMDRSKVVEKPDGPDSFDLFDKKMKGEN